AGETMNGPAVVGQRPRLAQKNRMSIGRGDAHQEVGASSFDDPALDRLELPALVTGGRTIGTGGWLKQAQRAELEGRIAGEKRDPVGVRDQDALTGFLPRGFQRIELDAHDRYAEQRVAAYRLGQIVANPVDRRFNAEIAALTLSDGLLEIGAVGQVSPDQGVG